MAQKSVIAVDLGASSGRCVVVSLQDGRLSSREINRFPHGPEDRSGTLCWDLDYLWTGIHDGLASAFAEDPDIASIGVDSWAVDFVPVDRRGKALLPFVSYRDGRTTGIIPEFLAAAGLTDREMFQRTGVQSLDFNSLYQLYAVKLHPPSSYAALDRWMLLPDWVHFQLTGIWSTEYTNATTTQMLDCHDRDWDPYLVEAVGLSQQAMPPIREAGEVLGPVKPEFCREWGLSQPPKVVLPGTHDTASAVAALPSTAPSTYFISLGTWALVGRESLVPDLTDFAHAHGLSNEGGVFGTYRQLRNVSGLWLIQRVREELAPDSDFADWVAEAATVSPGRSLILPTDQRFFRTPNMTEEIRAFCRETGQPVPESHGELARCIFESLALNFADVLDDFRKGDQIHELHVVGGGGRNRMLCQMVADFLGAPVLAGPFEASALGNALVQMIGLGWIEDLAEGRRILRASEEFVRCEPNPGARSNAIRASYHALLSPEKDMVS
ncbi:rhamnulokinase family protein [Tropicimonas sp. IMCC34043]|uniref:rhamnulokinase n=1 Tax=Tropicimonas sp. IMCC34043 TaxID=2248760 RepID=UPI000E27CE07|nr:rhamnulokinase family protein [Tropicimonas sp. IMCC34043]